MSARKTVDFTTSLRPHPAFFSFASMFERTTWVWALMPAGTAPVRGSEPTWPATKTRGPATTRPEYGGPPGPGGSIRSIMVSAATSGRGINSLAIRRQDLFEFSRSRSESVGRSLMTNARKRPSLPGPEYRIKVAFRVPMDYVFAWCTDYTPDDGRLEGEKYARRIDRKSTRLNSSHRCISYAVFCLKKKKKKQSTTTSKSLKKKRSNQSSATYSDDAIFIERVQISCKRWLGMR